MAAPWKVITCSNDSCFAEALDANGVLDADFKIYPEIDTPEFTQYTCPRCGKTETWGVTRCKIAKIIYERLNGRV